MDPKRETAGGGDAVSLDPAQAVALADRIRARIAERPPELVALEKLLPGVETGRLRLPVVAGTLNRVMGLMNSEEVELGELTYAVEMDPPLAAKIVGLANSAALRGSDPVLNVRDALMRMGLGEARNLVVAVAMRSGVFELPGAQSEAQALWEHSVATALCCQSLLQEIPPWQSSGFLLGLVHDVGRIVLLGFLEEAGRRSVKIRRLAPEARAAFAEGLHAEVGAVTATSWRFPDAFVQALRLHHEPDLALEPGIELTAALYCADTLAHLAARHWKPGTSDALDGQVTALLAPLGLGLSDCNRLLVEMEGGLSALAKLG